MKLFLLIIYEALDTIKNVYGNTSLQKSKDKKANQRQAKTN